MRSPLQAVENELAPSGFVRTHRSWLVNAKKVTTLKPRGLRRLHGGAGETIGSAIAPFSRRLGETQRIMIQLREAPAI